MAALANQHVSKVPTKRFQMFRSLKKQLPKTVDNLDVAKQHEREKRDSR